MKILIVDDSPTEQAMISTCIRQLGAQLLTALTGEQALALFVAERPDIVLLDVVLPDISGFEVAQKIREAEQAGDWSAIIFLSALNRDEDIEQGIAAGGDDYLPKPVSPIVLSAKIRAMQRLIQMRISLLVLTRKLDSANRELQRLSAIDGLTGIANRRAFDTAIDREWRRARRNGGNIALLMFDVDHFKRFNDTYGHQAGDDTLRQVAAVIQQNMERAADVAARYGGEEFAAILPETTMAGACRVAEKIRNDLRNLSIPHCTSTHGRVTLSIGVAAARPDGCKSWDELILAADHALYLAKDGGRDAIRPATTMPLAH